MVIPANTVIKYLRDNKGNPRGVIVAVRLSNGKVSVHYSYCNKKDKFTKEMALKIALGRAYTSSPLPLTKTDDLDFSKIPHQVNREISAFNQRVQKYYHVHPDNIITWK